MIGRSLLMGAVTVGLWLLTIAVLVFLIFPLSVFDSLMRTRPKETA